MATKEEMRNKMKGNVKPGTGSSIKDRFKKQKQDLLKRHQEQVENKDSGNEFPTVFDKEKIPKGVEFWKPGKGDHIIDIIPFFSGCQNPRVTEGELAYVVDFWVHLNVGPMRTPFCCSAKNFKESDPMCEYIAANRLSKDDWKKVASKRRTTYLIWCHDTPEEEKKGLQIWEVAHFYFEEKIDEIAKSPRGGGALAFSDVESGKSIAFTIKVTGKYTDAQGTERDSLGYIGHRFVDRDNPEIPTRILEQTFPLDEVIKLHPDYDEFAEAFFGKDKSDDNEDDEASFVENSYKEEDDIPSKDQKVKKGKKRPEPEPEEEVTEDEETTDDEGADDGEEDTDTWETDDEDKSEEESEESNEEEEITECPHDPDSFGEVDEHDECEANGGCPLWDSCSDEATKRAKAKELAKKAQGKKPTATSTKKKIGK